MKSFYASLLTLALIVSLGVGHGDTGKKTTPPVVNKATPQQQPAQPASPQPKKNEREPWPRTFVPSEKITADSVVSFPADI